MAAKSENGKTWLSTAGMVIKILLNITLYVVLILGAIKLTSKAYDFSYQVFGDVSVESEPGTDIMVTIRDGESSSHLADDLTNKNVVVNKYSFLVRLKLMVDSDDPILPGVYQLNTSMNYKEIIETVTDPAMNLDAEE